MNISNISLNTLWLDDSVLFIIKDAIWRPSALTTRITQRTLEKCGDMFLSTNPIHPSNIKTKMMTGMRIPARANIRDFLSCPSLRILSIRIEVGMAPQTPIIADKNAQIMKKTYRDP